MNELANSFFKNGDKAYAENLNDGVLVGNAFDWTVDVALPGDTGSTFPNSSTVSKAKVCDVSITPNSNLSIGSTISNSSGSSQTYRLTVYPNFNRFGGFKSISLTADSGVTFYIANKGGTSPIANNLDYTNLGNVPELKVLKEYDIVVTIPSGKSVTGLGFVLQSTTADVSGSISQDNVTGLDDRLDEIESDISDMVDLIYPIGSIYMSVNSANPSTLFGGTWQQLKDKFLLSAGDTYSAGATGGEATHTLTQNEMPSHTHTQNSHTHTTDNHYHMPSSLTEYFVTSEESTANNTRVSYNASGNRLVDGQMDTSDSTFHHRSATSSEGVYVNSTTATNQNTGGGQSHNNMPPYLAVYMWKRTA